MFKVSALNPKGYNITTFIRYITAMREIQLPPPLKSYSSLISFCLPSLPLPPIDLFLAPPQDGNIQ